MDLTGYEKTGASKVFAPGEHIMVELIPIMPRFKTFNVDNTIYIPSIGTAIPKEYKKISIKKINNDIYGTYLAVVSENIVTVTALEYQIIGTDLKGYYDYGQKVMNKENNLGKAKVYRK